MVATLYKYEIIIMLKMKQLTEISGENKSTILFYIKEGLLPQPTKIKTNVHLYNEKCIEILKFIKYFKNSLHYSLEQIKTILQDEAIDFSSDISMIINSLENISIGERIYSIPEVLEKTHISEETFKMYINQNIIRGDTKYSNKDIEIIEILKHSQELMSLIEEYVRSAKSLATLENEMGAKIMGDNKQNNTSHKIVFDTVLKLKPYIFNSHTLLENKRRQNEQ